MKKEFKQTFKSKLTIAICLLTLAASSCKKEATSPNTPPSETVSSFASIKAPSNFGWNNAGTLTFKFTGQADKNYNSILKVLGSDNSVIFQKLQNGSTNFSTTLNIPSVYKTITVVFGGVQKTFITNNGSVTMNLN